MEVFTMKDLTSQTKRVCGTAVGDNPVVITNNGIPTKLIIDITGLDLEEELKSLRQAKAMRAVEQMRMSTIGIDMDEVGIEAVIAASRAERKA